jgi:hypothetical protein
VTRNIDDLPVKELIITQAKKNEPRFSPGAFKRNGRDVYQLLRERHPACRHIERGLNRRVTRIRLVSAMRRVTGPPGLTSQSVTLPRETAGFSFGILDAEPFGFRK